MFAQKQHTAQRGVLSVHHHRFRTTFNDLITQVNFSPFRGARKAIRKKRNVMSWCFVRAKHEQNTTQSKNPITNHVR